MSQFKRKKSHFKMVRLAIMIVVVASVLVVCSSSATASRCPRGKFRFVKEATDVVDDDMPVTDYAPSPRIRGKRLPRVWDWSKKGPSRPSPIRANVAAAAWSLRSAATSRASTLSPTVCSFQCLAVSRWTVPWRVRALDVAAAKSAPSSNGF